MFISRHTLKWTKTCRSSGDFPHAHTAHFLLNRHTPERAGRELWAITARTLGRLPHGRFFVDLTPFADRPDILRRFAVRYGKYLKDNRTALDATIIDPTGLVARHVAMIRPKWEKNL